VQVFDRTPRQFSFACPILSNVGHPRSIWGIGVEVPGRQIIVDRPTGFFLRGLRLEITEKISALEYNRHTRRSEIFTP